ncbi:PKD domain-containing protein [Solimonas sp. K1W22B-7]|uniref:PKD domain-containing protein n=1 Tax=Solimonas sp. K1W22B-7 TaxID=2303331 RepID=UPI000E32E586|nr:PKD domain-containing protein [Solimonas sp. K1W22B-7]AXQ29559.1 PKD domain-containing protein [Solimonas sp. K1W22B-7]
MHTSWQHKGGAWLVALAVLISVTACKGKSKDKTPPTLTAPAETLAVSEPNQELILGIGDNKKLNTDSLQLLIDGSDVAAVFTAPAAGSDQWRIRPAAGWPEGRHGLVVIVADAANNKGRWEGNLNADYSPPALVASDPTANATIAQPDQPLTFNVQDQNLPASISSWSVKQQGGAFVGEVSLVNGVLTLVPAAGWLDGPLQIEIVASDIFGHSGESSFSYTVKLPDLLAMPDATPTSGFAPLAVQLKPTIITKFAVNTYEWDFSGDGKYDVSDPVGRTQNFTYTTPGTYNAKLRVTDSRGKVSEGAVTMEVLNRPPAASVSVDRTNGQVPLTATFSAVASDSDGIARFEWDFNGDGTVDRTTITGSGVSTTYETAGSYPASVTVFDSRGASTRVRAPNIEIRAGEAGSPSVTLTASPVRGFAPLRVSFSATATPASGDSVSTLEWDFDGNGVTDATGASATYEYTLPGTYYPAVTVTTAQSKKAKSVGSMIVDTRVSLSVTDSTIDTVAGTVATVATDLSSNLELRLVIENEAGAVVREVVPWKRRTAGKYSDTWNGTNDAGKVLPRAAYYAVLQYKVGDEVRRLDARGSTGGHATNPPRSSIPRSFQPYNNDPLIVTFTLDGPAEVTAFMGLFNTNTRLVTFLDREPLGAGTHAVSWDGNGDDGKPILTNPSDPFLFGIWAYDFADNAVFVQTPVSFSDLQISPAILVPSDRTASADGRTHLQFKLTKAATIELVVSHVETGQQVRRQAFLGVPAGDASVKWDGRNNAGKFVAPGKYRLGIRAIDDSGHASPFEYRVQRVYY